MVWLLTEKINNSCLVRWKLSRICPNWGKNKINILFINKEINKINKYLIYKWRQRYKYQFYGNKLLKLKIYK